MTRLPALILAALALACPPARAGPVPVTPATVQAALKAAKAGDTIKLSPEVYKADLVLQNQSLDPPAVLDATGATLTGNLSFINIAGWEIKGGRWTGVCPICGYNAERLTIRDAAFAYTPGAANGYAVRVTNGKAISVTNSTVSGFRMGVAIANADGVEVSGMSFENMTTDGVNLAGVHHFKVNGSAFSGTSPSAGAHPDAVQFQMSWLYAPSSDGEVNDNWIVGDTDGLLAAPHTRLYPKGSLLYDGRSLAADTLLADPPLVNVDALRNRVANRQANAIGLPACTPGCRFMDNDVRTLPGAPYQSRLNIDPAAVHCGNKTGGALGKAAVSEKNCDVPPPVDVALLASLKAQLSAAANEAALARGSIATLQAARDAALAGIATAQAALSAP